MLIEVHPYIFVCLPTPSWNAQATEIRMHPVHAHTLCMHTPCVCTPTQTAHITHLRLTLPSFPQAIGPRRVAVRCTLTRWQATLHSYHLEGAHASALETRWGMRMQLRAEQQAGMCVQQHRTADLASTGGGGPMCKGASSSCMGPQLMHGATTACSMSTIHRSEPHRCLGAFCCCPIIMPAVSCC